MKKYILLHITHAHEIYHSTSSISTIFNVYSEALHIIRGIERIAGAYGTVLEKYQRARRVVRAVNLPSVLLKCSCYLQVSFRLVSISHEGIRDDKGKDSKIKESAERSEKELTNVLESSFSRFLWDFLFG